MSREEALRRAVDLLGEHFDAVQVLVSYNEDGLTRCRHLGGGNWYARQGMAHDFIKCDDAQEVARQIAGAIQPSDDE